MMEVAPLLVKNSAYLLELDFPVYANYKVLYHQTVQNFTPQILEAHFKIP